LARGLPKWGRRTFKVGVARERAILPSQELCSFGECKMFVPLGNCFALVVGAIFSFCTHLQVYLELLNTGGKCHNLEDNQAIRIVKVFIR
jgi:hypothetical protein